MLKVESGIGPVLVAAGVCQEVLRSIHAKFDGAFETTPRIRGSIKDEVPALSGNLIYRRAPEESADRGGKEERV